MDASMGFGIILILWAVVFEVAGFGLMYLFYRALQRDEARLDRQAQQAADASRPAASAAPVLSGSASRPQAP
jgi:flagellar basal body-associated protein FliL